MLRCESLLGAAGSGKSYLLRQRIEEDKKYARLSASTGIAAVNLGPGVSTVHSTLRFFDLRSAQAALERGQLTQKFIGLAQAGYKMLVIDEVSMVSGELLDIIYTAALRAHNELAEGLYRINDPDIGKRNSVAEDATGILLCGDPLQLPPVSTKYEPATYFFQAKCWPQFEAGLTHLTTSYRQTDPKFLKALQLLRAGKGVDAAFALREAGVKFRNTIDPAFDGVTLFAVNTQVDGYNKTALDSLDANVVTYLSRRWGKEAAEWKNIPEALVLKPGALVMTLANKRSSDGQFCYVNGDLGTLAKDSTDDFATVTTKRGYEGFVEEVWRHNTSFAADDIRPLKELYESSVVARDLQAIFDVEKRSKRWVAIYMGYMMDRDMDGMPYYDPDSGGAVVGAIRYMPLRLAYSSSVHKTQGLTLDTVQIDIGSIWIGNPAMMYVAISRCKTADGLTIVGDVARLSRRIKTAREVMWWV
jgi:hypothetical protein